MFDFIWIPRKEQTALKYCGVGLQKTLFDVSVQLPTNFHSFRNTLNCSLALSATVAEVPADYSPKRFRSKNVFVLLPFNIELNHTTKNKREGGGCRLGFSTFAATLTTSSQAVLPNSPQLPFHRLLLLAPPHLGWTFNHKERQKRRFITDHPLPISQHRRGNSNAFTSWFQN